MQVNAGGRRGRQGQDRGTQNQGEEGTTWEGHWGTHHIGSRRIIELEPMLGNAMGAVRMFALSGQVLDGTQ